MFVYFSVLLVLVMFARRTLQPLATSSPSRLLSQRSFSTGSSLARSVIVTGAAQGIGRAIAVQLAQDGYDVCANDIDSKKEALDEVNVPEADENEQARLTPTGLPRDHIAARAQSPLCNCRCRLIRVR